MARSFGWRWFAYCMTFGLVVMITQELMGLPTGPISGLVAGICAQLSWHFLTKGA